MHNMMYKSSSKTKNNKTEIMQTHS